MKKYIFSITAVLLLFLFSCNRPEEQLLQEVEQSRQKPYSESVSYTLTADDYNTIAKVGLVAAQNSYDSAQCASIGVYHSFSQSRPAAVYLPPFLSQKFPALDSGSYVRVTYNYDHIYSFADSEVVTFTNANYSEIGLSNSYFDSQHNPDNYLPSWLNSKEKYNSYSRILIKYLYKNDDGSFVVKVSYYENDPINKWFIPNYYLLQDQDYENLRPNTVVATNHYFTADYPASEYIPVLLKVKFPYAAPGDQKIVIYKYIGKFQYNLYTFDGNTWTSIEQKTDQFFNDGQRWAFDPTVRYTLSCNDYQVIVDWVAENKPLYMDPKYSNTEYYFGASSHFCNFDMRLNVRRNHDTLKLLADDDQVAMRQLWGRIVDAINIFLQTKYPNAQPQIYGVDVYYYITFQTYEPPRKTYWIEFQCTGQGEFTPIKQDKDTIQYSSYIVPVE